MAADAQPSDRGDHRSSSLAGEHPSRPDAPILDLRLWPNRSLPRRGARVVLVLLGIGLAVPLLPLAGTALVWGIFPFELAVLGGLYLAFRRSYADGALTEELRLWPDMISVVRREARGRVLTWRADPFWVKPRLIEDGKVEQYLILRGDGREIELGAFLSPDERVALHEDLTAALGRLRHLPVTGN